MIKKLWNYKYLSLFLCFSQGINGITLEKIQTARNLYLAQYQMESQGRKDAFDKYLQDGLKNAQNSAFRLAFNSFNQFLNDDDFLKKNESLWIYYRRICEVFIDFDQDLVNLQNTRDQYIKAVGKHFSDMKNYHYYCFMLRNEARRDFDQRIDQYIVDSFISFLDADQETLMQNRYFWVGYKALCNIFISKEGCTDTVERCLDVGTVAAAAQYFNYVGKFQNSIIGYPHPMSDFKGNIHNIIAQEILDALEYSSVQKVIINLNTKQDAAEDAKKGDTKNKANNYHWVTLCVDKKFNTITIIESLGVDPAVLDMRKNFAFLVANILKKISYYDFKVQAFDSCLQEDTFQCAVHSLTYAAMLARDDVKNVIAMLKEIRGTPKKAESLLRLLDQKDNQWQEVNTLKDLFAQYREQILAITLPQALIKDNHSQTEILDNKLVKNDAQELQGFSI